MIIAVIAGVLIICVSIKEPAQVVEIKNPAQGGLAGFDCGQKNTRKVAGR